MRALRAACAPSRRGLVLVAVVLAGAACQASPGRPGQAPLVSDLEVARRAPEIERHLLTALQCLEALQRAAATYPASLAELTRTADCQMSAPAPDLSITYYAGHPASDGQRHAFTLCGTMAETAAARSPGVTASERSTAVAGRVVRTSSACADSWRDDPAAITHCLFAFEAASPTKSFPARMREIGPLGAGCLSPDVIVTEHVARTAEYRFTYLPDVPEADGRITGFVVIGTPRDDSQSRQYRPSLWVNAEGVWHTTRDARMAHGADARLAGRNQWQSPVTPAPPPTPLQLADACEHGEYAACRDVGLELLRRPEAHDLVVASEGRAPAPRQPGQSAPSRVRVRGRSYLERACDGGIGDACRHLAAALTDAERGTNAEQAWLERGCTAHDAESCVTLANRVYAAGGVEADARRAVFRAQACRAGHLAACVDVAGYYQRGIGVAKDSTRAVAQLEESCRSGSPEACLMLSRAVRDGWAAPPDAARAERLLALACAGRDTAECAAYR